MGGGRREEGTMGEEERRRIPPESQAQTPQRAMLQSPVAGTKGKRYMCQLDLHP